MKAIKLKKIFLLSLPLLFLAFGSCEKVKLKNFLNMVEIVLPADCEGCSVVLFTDEGEIEVLYGDYSILNFYERYDYSDGIITAEIDWDGVYLDGFEYDDNKGMAKSTDLKIALVNDMYYSSVEVIAQVNIQYEAKKIYRWDPTNGTVEETGEKTTKSDMKDYNDRYKEDRADSNNDGTSGASCDLSNYKGPEFNIQIDSQCKTAYAYDCAGNQTGVDAACSIYKEYQRQDSSIPNCPYCN